LDDSSYETDSVVLSKYKNDPLKYVLGDDLNKKSELEGANGQCHRLMKAKGDRNEISISSFFN
jgi:hypothetical protein